MSKKYTFAHIELRVLLTSIGTVLVVFLILWLLQYPLSHSDKDEKQTNAVAFPADKSSETGITETQAPKMPQVQSIPVSQEDFQAMVKFIEKNGFSTGDGDMQYTFFDSHGNRHALMTIKRDENNKPSKQGKVVQISVWSYYEGIKDQEHFFGWQITDGKVMLAVPDIDKNIPDFTYVKFGYQEFLAEVRKRS